MRTVLKTFGVVSAIATAPSLMGKTDASAASASSWCAMSSLGMGTQTCGFTSLDQCRAYVTTTGFCQPDARYSAPAEKARRR